MSRAGPTPRRALIVDDDQAVLDVLSDFLSDQGWDCLCADSDTAAYRLLQAEPESLVALIVDLNLGQGVTGFDVAREARRRRAALPVVYITGGEPEPIARHGVRDAAFHEKPFDLDALAATLERLVPAD